MIFHEAQILKCLHDYFMVGDNSPINDISWQLIEHWRILSRQNPQLTTRISYFIPVNINGLFAASFFLKIEYAHSEIVGAPSREFRRGLEYEALIYRSLLNPHALIASPQHIASWKCEEDCSFAFLMTCIRDAQRINHFVYNEGLVNTASWLGCFQRQCETLGLDSLAEAISIPHLSEDSHRSWLESAIPFTAKNVEAESILSEFPQHIDALVDTLTDAPVSLVHGDFYPSNILVNPSGDVFPIDWEAASVGPELLDLCSLVQFWPPKVVDSCLTAYRQSRWSDSSPRSFGLTFQAGCIYQLARHNLESLDVTNKRGQRYLRGFSDALLHFREELNAG